MLAGNCIAINGFAFPSEMPLADALRAARSAGFSGFEIGMSLGDSIDADPTGLRCTEIARAAADLGLQLTGLACGAWMQVNYASPAAADRTAACDLTLRLLDRAAALGAGAILVIPAVVGRADDASPRTSYADALHRALDALLSLRHEAESRRVAIGIENVWNKFLLSPVEFAKFLDEVNSPWVGAYFDIGNVMPFGYPQDWIATLGRRIVRVHVKDYDLSKPGRAGFCPLGEGSVDWSEVVRALHIAGYTGPLTFEGRGDAADIAARLRAIADGRSRAEIAGRTVAP